MCMSCFFCVCVHLQFAVFHFIHSFPFFAFFVFPTQIFLFLFLSCRNFVPIKTETGKFVVDPVLAYCWGQAIHFVQVSEHACVCVCVCVRVCVCVSSPLCTHNTNTRTHTRTHARTYSSGVAARQRADVDMHCARHVPVQDSLCGCALADGQDYGGCGHNGELCVCVC